MQHHTKQRYSKQHQHNIIYFNTAGHHKRTQHHITLRRIRPRIEKQPAEVQAINNGFGRLFGPGSIPNSLSTLHPNPFLPTEFDTLFLSHSGKIVILE